MKLCITGGCGSNQEVSLFIDGVCPPGLSLSWSHISHFFAAQMLIVSTKANIKKFIIVQSSKDSKDQESIQSSTTHVKLVNGGGGGGTKYPISLEVNRQVSHTLGSKMEKILCP